jgi:hypothetical protein
MYLHDSVKNMGMRDLLQRWEWHPQRLLKEVFANDAIKCVGAEIRA